MPVTPRRALSTCAASSATRDTVRTQADASPFAHQRDAAGVVAAVLEPPQALDQDRDDVAARDRADDAAHGSSPSSSRRLPARDRHLLRARDGELAGGRVLGDGRAGADVGAARDAHRRDQRRVGADEAVVLDHRAVLVRAVVVAGDGAGADVDAARRPRCRRCRRGGWPWSPRRRGSPSPRRSCRCARPRRARARAAGARRARCGSARRRRRRRGARRRAPRCRPPIVTLRSTQFGPMRTPSPSVTLPSNTQFTSIDTSRPHSSVPRTSMRAGSASVTPASSSCSAQIL